MPLRKLSNLKVDNLPSLHKSRNHSSNSPESPCFNKAIGNLLTPFSSTHHLSSKLHLRDQVFPSIYSWVKLQILPLLLCLLIVLLFKFVGRTIIKLWIATIG
jgi:hypothetical protein